MSQSCPQPGLSQPSHEEEAHRRACVLSLLQEGQRFQEPEGTCAESPWAGVSRDEARACDKGAGKFSYLLTCVSIKLVQLRKDCSLIWAICGAFSS